MAVQPVNPYILKDVDFLFVADDFGAHLTSIEVVPAASVVSIKGLKPEATFTDVTTATWTLNLSIIQDWTETGLSRYLYENEGQTKLIKFTPKGLPTFTAEAIITPGSIGGAIDAFAVATVSLGLKGKPEIVETP